MFGRTVGKVWMRCPNCGTWNREYRRERCSNCRAALEPVPDHLAMAIVATVLLPLIGLVSVYFSVRTNRSLTAGDYVKAREISYTARAWALAAIWLALASLLFFGIVFLLVPNG